MVEIRKISLKEIVRLTFSRKERDDDAGGGSGEQ
jgi:hypothetical protein